MRILSTIALLLLATTANAQYLQPPFGADLSYDTDQGTVPTYLYEDLNPGNGLEGPQNCANYPEAGSRCFVYWTFDLVTRTGATQVFDWDESEGEWVLVAGWSSQNFSVYDGVYGFPIPTTGCPPGYTCFPPPGANGGFVGMGNGVTSQESWCFLCKDDGMQQNGIFTGGGDDEDWRSQFPDPNEL